MTDPKRHAEHLDFLVRVSGGPKPAISRTTAMVAAQTWGSLWAASGYTLPVPSACTNADGIVFYSWNNGRHHLEVEFIPGQAAELFYRDRDETDGFWGYDWLPGDPIPQEVIDLLPLFVTPASPH